MSSHRCNTGNRARDYAKAIGTSKGMGTEDLIKWATKQLETQEWLYEKVYMKDGQIVVSEL
jgi:hypothetical protein